MDPAECCIGLQALTEHVSNIGIAVVTDTASEEGIWRDEPVALSEDPMTVRGQGWELSREAGQGTDYPALPPQRLTGSASAHREVQRSMGWRSVCWTLGSGEWCWGKG